MNYQTRFQLTVTVISSNLAKFLSLFRPLIKQNIGFGLEHLEVKKEFINDRILKCLSDYLFNLKIIER